MDGLELIPGSKTTDLTRQITVRLIPAALLQPRLRLIDGDRLITGPAFSLLNIVEESLSPSERINVPVNSAISQRILYSFEASKNQINRFNSPDDAQGVYYAGTTLPASIAEIQWHLEHPGEAPHFDRTRTYRSVSADIKGFPRNNGLMDIFLVISSIRSYNLSGEEIAHPKVVKERQAVRSSTIAAKRRQSAYRPRDRRSPPARGAAGGTRSMAALLRERNTGQVREACQPRGHQNGREIGGPGANAPAPGGRADLLLAFQPG